MSLLFWSSVSKASKRYVLYLSPEQIYAIINEWYPESKLKNNRIEVRRSFWYTRDLIMHSGPHYTVLESSWAMSKGMWIIFFASLLFALIPGIALGVIHLMTNVDFIEELIWKVYYEQSYSNTHYRSSRQSYPVSVK
jgi:hypothetical protein